MGLHREELTEGIGMLVLSRKKNESIVINDDITIVVVEIRGDKVRLGVEAPKEVPVHHRVGRNVELQRFLEVLHQANNAYVLECYRLTLLLT